MEKISDCELLGVRDVLDGLAERCNTISYSLSYNISCYMPDCVHMIYICCLVL